MEVIGAPMNLSTGSVFGSIRILKLYIGESIHEEELSATKIICGELVEVDESKEVQLPFKACIPFGSMEVMTEGIINTKASKILARRVVERTLNFSLCFKEQSGRDVKWREVNQQAVWIIRMSIGNHKISSLSHEQEVIGKDSMGQLNEVEFTLRGILQSQLKTTMIAWVSDIVLAKSGLRIKILIISLFPADSSLSFSKYPYLLQTGAALVELFGWRTVILMFEALLAMIKKSSMFLLIGKPANNRVQSDHDAYRAFSLR
ncbi:hypothetical protein V6N13_135026 [Hibiscus sabdariffa]